jgi:hypothetical protein
MPKTKRNENTPPFPIKETQNLDRKSKKATLFKLIKKPKFLKKIISEKF